MSEKRTGDRISTGDISNAQGIALGRNAQAIVIGSNSPELATIDAVELRQLLGDLFEALGQMSLQRETKIASQTAVGKALDGVDDDTVQAATVLTGVRQAGEALKHANVAVEEGTSLWSNVEKLARLLGPMAGTAQDILKWFDIH